LLKRRILQSGCKEQTRPPCCEGCPPGKLNSPRNPFFARTPKSRTLRSLARTPKSRTLRSLARTPTSRALRHTRMDTPTYTRAYTKASARARTTSH
jgi:hypothetical protein